MSDIDYTTERWLPVAMPGYQDFYDVSDHGRVRSRKFGKIKMLCPHVNHDSYQRINLTWPKRTTRMHSVHRLVALTFIGPPPTEKHVVAHNDGTTDNNRVSNLRWATSAENRADMVLHGTAKRGARHNLAKLSEDDVANVYKLRESGLLQREIAEHYGVTTVCINSILRGKNWGYLKNPVLIADNRGEAHSHAKLKNVDILKIHSLRSLGHSHQSIANTLGFNRRYVSKILQGKRWAHLMPTSKSGCADGLQLPL